VKWNSSFHPAQIDGVFIDLANLLLCSGDKKLMIMGDTLFYQLMWKQEGQKLLSFRAHGVEFVPPWELEAFLQETVTSTAHPEPVEG
jgi:hypothetical protein